MEIPPFRFGPYREPTDPVALRILDAAYDELLTHGLRRATLDMVAKRAQVGRMTLHRRYPNKQELIEAVFQRANGRIVASIRDVAAAQSSLVDALAESLALGVESVREDPLLGRLFETDRDAVIPYFTYDATGLLRESTRYVLEQLEAAGLGLQPPQSEIIAEAMIRLCQSVVVTPDVLVDLRDGVGLRDYMRSVIAALLPS